MPLKDTLERESDLRRMEKSDYHQRIAIIANRFRNGNREDKEASKNDRLLFPARSMSKDPVESCFAQMFRRHGGCQQATNTAKGNNAGRRIHEFPRAARVNTGQKREGRDVTTRL